MRLLRSRSLAAVRAPALRRRLTVTSVAVEAADTDKLCSKFAAALDAVEPKPEAVMWLTNAPDATGRIAANVATVCESAVGGVADGSERCGIIPHHASRSGA